MRIKNILPLLLAGSFMVACTPAKQAGNSFEWGQVPQQPDLSWADSVGSRQLPGDKMIISANSFGAVADSTVLSTEAIQKAIDSCAVSGGGTVILQPGYYQTGALFVKSGVNLQIGKGVTLLASPDIHHYPEFRSRIAGIEMTWPAAVINIVDEKNAAVSGEGTLDCRGKVFWDKYWEMRKNMWQRAPLDCGLRLQTGTGYPRRTQFGHHTKRFHSDAYRVLGMSDSLFRLLHHRRIDDQQ